MDKQIDGGTVFYLPCYDKYVIRFHRKGESKTHVIEFKPV